MVTVTGWGGSSKLCLFVTGAAYQKNHIRLELTDTVPVATNQPERNKRSGNNRGPKQERKIYRLKMMFPSVLGYSSQ